MAAPTTSLQWSSMVQVAGGEEGSIRHDDDGRPAPSGGSPLPEERKFTTNAMIDMNRLRGLTAELGFIPATTDEADIERHRQHNTNAEHWLARSHRFGHLRREQEQVLIEGPLLNVRGRSRPHRRPRALARPAVLVRLVGAAQQIDDLPDQSRIRLRHVLRCSKGSILRQVEVTSGCGDGGELPGRD
jgi:hypothetical protein